jgi:hypothetical protein
MATIGVCGRWADWNNDGRPILCLGGDVGEVSDDGRLLGLVCILPRAASLPAKALVAGWGLDQSYLTIGLGRN